MGCRHPRAVPLAFRVSAQFDGLAHMSVLTCSASSHMHRRTKGACRSWLIGLPAHAASQAHPRHHHADSEKGQLGGHPPSPSRDLQHAARPHPVKHPLKLELSIVVISGLPRYLRTRQALKLCCACTKRHSTCMQARKIESNKWGPWTIGEGKTLCC